MSHILYENGQPIYAIVDGKMVEVQEVKHGRWEFDFLWYVCSSCGKHISFSTLDDDSEPAFCPNCGAKMDEVEDNAN